MTLDLQLSQDPNSPHLASVSFQKVRNPHPIPPRAKKPPPLLAKNPPPPKSALAASRVADEVAASKLHWIPIPDMKVKGTVWEVIGRETTTNAPSSPAKFHISKRTSACDQVSPRAVITGDSNASKAYPKFHLPEELLKQHFFKANPKRANLKNVKHQPVCETAPRSAKERTSESVLSNARLQSVSICLKGLRLDDVNKIVTSLEALFDCLQSIDFGAISQESLAKHTITPRPVEAIGSGTSVGPPTSKEELYQITTHRHHRLLSREDLALISDSWPTNEEARKLMTLKLSNNAAQGHPVDLFLIQLLDNASIQTKIEALLCRIEVELETRRLLKILARVMKCSELLIEGLAPHGILSRILETVLALGNRLNSTDIRGFKVKSLEKLKDCRSHKLKEVSLMNVLAISIINSGAHFDSLQRDIAALASILKEVSEIDLNQTAADLGAVASKVAKAQRELVAAHGLIGLSCSPKSLSSCSSTKDSWQSVVSESDGSEITLPCTEENVIAHLAGFTRWAEGIIAILQKHFFLSKDRLATICKLLGEPDDKVINGVVEALSSFLSSLVQACKAEHNRRTITQTKGETSVETARIRPKIALPPVNPISEVWTVDLDKASFDEVFDLLNVPLNIDESDDSSCPFAKLGINRSWTSRAEDLAPRSLLRSRVSQSKGSLKASITMSRGEHGRSRSSLQVHQNVIAISSDGGRKETISPVFSVDLPLSTGTPSELTTPMSCYYDNTRLNTRSFNLQPLCAACDLMRAWSRAENYGDVLMSPLPHCRQDSAVKPSSWNLLLIRFAKAVHNSLATLQQYVGSKLRLHVPQAVVREWATKISDTISVVPPDNLSLDCLTPTVKKEPIQGGELRRVKLVTPDLDDSPQSSIFFTPLNEVIRVRHVRCQKQPHTPPSDGLSESSARRDVFETPINAGEDGIATWSLFHRYGPSFERVFRL